MIDDGCFVLFVCEGKQERAIVETLLERDETAPLPLVVRDPMTDAPYVNRCRRGDFVSRYLNVDYGGRPLRVVRIVDKKTERLRLPSAYADKVEIVDVNTRPEIEILTIIAENRFDEYARRYKSRMTPSEYCRRVLGMRDVKRYETAKAYWSTPGLLELAIAEYRRLHRYDRGETGPDYLLREARR